jgi:hypothetical protein
MPLRLDSVTCTAGYNAPVRNAVLGYLLFSTGALAWPVLLIAVYTLTHWVTIAAAVLGVVIFYAIAAFYQVRAIRSPIDRAARRRALTKHEEFHLGPYGVPHPDLCPHCAKSAGKCKTETD